MTHLNLNDLITLFIAVMIIAIILTSFALLWIKSVLENEDEKNDSPASKPKRMIQNDLEDLEDVEDGNTLFETIEVYEEFDVAYCTVTKVMYAVSVDGTLTLLVNADGAPMLYKGEDYPTKTH